MIPIDNKSFDEKTSAANDADAKAPVRCIECDRLMDHYITFVTPTNENRVVCWQCLGREEKGFNAKRGFHREARSGYIPR
jgi:hypothetical protein